MIAAERGDFDPPEGFVRYLGGFEQLHWLFSQGGPRGFAHAVEVSGATTPEQWRVALDALQRSQPLFSVRIDVDGGRRPFFRRREGVPIPMRVVDGRSDASWEAEMGEELAHIIPARNAPLLRAVLIHGTERSTFILVAHHSISDGVSMTEALCDLVRALTGEQLPPRAVPQSTEVLLGVTPQVPAVLSPERAAQRRLHFLAHYLKPFTVRSLRLDVASTHRLRQRARAEGTTVHGALCSAIIQAVRARTSAGRRDDIRLLSPIDARKHCGLGNTSSMCIGAAIIPVSAETGTDPWTLARHIKSEHAGPASRAGLSAALQMISGAVATMTDLDSAMDFIDPVFNYHVAVSNIGEALGTSGSPRVRIESLWGPGLLLGCDGEQYIGAVTFDGRLHLTHTAYSPIPELLEATSAALASMCEAA